MFADGYFAISFPELLGTVVTITGIWLIVRQLTEAKLASQMDGLLDLVDQWTNSREKMVSLLDLIESDKWDGLNGQEAYVLINEDEKYLNGYAFLMNWYELIAVLVQKKALDKGIVFEYFGEYIIHRWNKVEKIAKHHQVQINSNRASNWEGLAIEFEKLAS